MKKLIVAVLILWVCLGICFAEMKLPAGIEEVRAGIYKTGDECKYDDVRMMKTYYKGEPIYRIEQCGLMSYTHERRVYGWKYRATIYQDYSAALRDYKKMKRNFEIAEHEKEIEKLKWRMVK